MNDFVYINVTVVIVLVYVFLTSSHTDDCLMYKPKQFLFNTVIKEWATLVETKLLMK